MDSWFKVIECDDGRTLSRELHDSAGLIEIISSPNRVKVCEEFISILEDYGISNISESGWINEEFEASHSGSIGYIRTWTISQHLPR